MVDWPSGVGVGAEFHEDFGRIRGVQEGNAFAIGAGFGFNDHPVPYADEPVELRLEVFHVKGDVVQTRAPFLEVLGDGAVL